MVLSERDEVGVSWKSIGVVVERLWMLGTELAQKCLAWGMLTGLYMRARQETDVSRDRQ